MPARIAAANWFVGRGVKRRHPERSRGIPLRILKGNFFGIARRRSGRLGVMRSKAAGHRALRLCHTLGNLPPSILVFALCRIGLFCQLIQERKERRRLTDKQTHVGQKLDHALGNSIGLGRTNDRTYRKTPAKEWAWLRHDQISLKVFSTEGRRIQIRKCYRHVSHRIDRSQGGRIARLVRPCLEVHCLSRADADQDSQDLHTAGPLRHRWIKAVTTLLDGGKMECCGVGNRLKELGMVYIVVSPGNGRVLSSE
jgi:hypothetical protein